jgi:hypothetical protein
MKVEEFISQEVWKLKNDFSSSQIREEVWAYLHGEYFSTLRLEAIICMCMELYAEIIIQSRS